jgi:hypothetical protein
MGKMDGRELRALEIAARMRITWEDGAWSVPSSTGSGKYRVVLKPDGNACTCPDFELHAKDCKHILAARFVVERDYGGQPLLVDLTESPAKKTYKQNWPLYNLAQQTEKYRFGVLLFDLCQALPEHPQPAVGRRRTAMADMVFACALKVYSTLSTRRFACDLRDAHELGYLSGLMNSMSVCS